MKRKRSIAITGGIGSGKSYVCQLLEKRGIRVYDCDEAAKRLMRTSEELQSQLTSLVGDSLYINKVLQKRVLASFLLASEANKQAVNSLVHPAVAKDFLQSPCEWLESAILFESGFYKRVHFDFIISVTAPEDVRMKRIMERDGIPEQQALEWIRCQMPQEEVARQSDFVIVNDGSADLEKQLDDLMNRIQKTVKQ